MTVTWGGSRRVEVIRSEDGARLRTVSSAAWATWRDEGALLFSRVTAGVGSLWEVELASGREDLVLEGEVGRSWWRAEIRADGGLGVLGGPVMSRSGIFVRQPGVSELEPWLGPGSVLTGSGWAPGGRTLAAIVDGALVQVHADRVATVLPRIASLWDPAFAPGGERLAVVREESDTTLLVFDGLDPDVW